MTQVDSSYQLAQQAQRIASLEDLLRRNEGSLSAVLGRVRDIELAVNTFNRSISKLAPDLSMVVEDLNATKRKVDLVDNSWRSTIKEFESVVVNEFRNNKPVPLANDPLFQRMSQEVQQQRADLHEHTNLLRRIGDTQSIDGKTLKQVESDAKWLTEQLRDVAAKSGDFSAQQQRRNEQFSVAIQEGKQEQEKGDNQLRGIIDAVIKSTREEMAVRFDSELKQRQTLQQDVVSNFSRIREDVMKGFAQTAANLRNVDETTSSLETVLRAEVRSRMTKMEELNKRADMVEERLRREALSAAEYLKALDTQLGAAIRDVRDATAAECRSQLDELWREIGEVKRTGGHHQAHKGGPTAASQQQQSGDGPPTDELAHQRSRLRLETEISKSKEEILGIVDKRLTDTHRALDTLATKQELQDATEVLNMKMEAKMKHDPRPSSTRRRSDTPPQASEGAGAVSKARIRQLEGRIDHTDKQIIAVSDAVKSVHEDIVDKVSSLERRMTTADGVQRNLQEVFERDQQQMEAYLQSIREQIVTMMEEEESPLSSSPKRRKQKTSGDGENNNEGDFEEKKDDDDDKDDEAGPQSPRQAAVYALLDDQVKALTKVTRSMDTKFQADITDLKSQQAQTDDLLKKTSKLVDSNTAKIDDNYDVQRRKQNEDTATLTERIDDLTESTVDRMSRIESDIKVLRLGGTPATPPPMGDKPSAASPTSDKRVDGVISRVDDLEKQLGAIEPRFESYFDSALKPGLMEEVRAEIDKKHVDQPAANAPAANAPASNDNDANDATNGSDKNKSPQKSATPSARSTPSASNKRTPPAKDGNNDDGNNDLNDTSGSKPPDPPKSPSAPASRASCQRSNKPPSADGGGGDDKPATPAADNENNNGGNDDA